MKRFVTRCVVFSVVFIPIIILYTTVKTNIHSPYQLSDDITTLITGDSHVQCAINTDALRGMKNISMNSEGPLYSYYKLKEILEYNPQVKNVIVGFHYHNLSSYYDDYTVGKHARKIMARHIDLLGYEDLLKLVKTYPSLIIPAFCKVVSFTNDDYPYIGSFSNQDTGDLKYSESVMKEKVRYQFFVNDEIRGVSNINVEYMIKLIRLCESKKVNLSFLTTPLHRKYRNEIPAYFLDLYPQWVKKFNRPVIDLMDLNLSDTDFLPDGEHLNARGALAATAHFLEKWKECGDLQNPAQKKKRPIRLSSFDERGLSPY